MRPGAAWRRTVALTGVCALPVFGVAARTPVVPPGAAWLLVELPSHRVVGDARRDILDAAIAPGSVIKIATLIAAVEDGVITPDTRILCRRTIDVDGHALTCVHPDLHRGLTPAEALGYSCNVFFASVAQRVRRTTLDAVLVRLGLAPIAPAAPTVSGALGLRGVTPSPRMLLDAFIRVAATPDGVRLAPAARSVLDEGLRLAASSGTASALGEAGLHAVAKTGTAAMPGGGFLGIVVAAVPVERPTHAIVVVAPGGAGADAAVIAAEVLVGKGLAGPGRAEAKPLRIGVAPQQGSAWRVSTLPVEDYVARVVAGEMAPGAPPAAHEAMAIAVRTFAESHRGRHATDGFDLCDLTHCQAMAARPTPASTSAARATAGLLLLDRGRPATVYFSAWCGGHTEVPSHVWPGEPDPSYLPARPDPACAGIDRWRSEIAEPQLRDVLLALGARGASVAALGVSERDPSGRAVRLHAGGMRPETFDANAFRMAAGRVLGWQVVKSTRFDVARTGNGYVLTGTGLGHGVGLCARGAAARAGTGASRDAILAAYYPGLTVGRLNGDERGIRVRLPEAELKQRDETRALAERELARVARRLGVADLPRIDLRFHPTVESFGRTTGLPWWTAARTQGSLIDLIPLAHLRTRGTLAPTLAHEFVHVLADAALAGRPLWVREGLAVALSGELDSEVASRAARGTVPSCPTDVELRTPSSQDAWRRAYSAAGACVARALAAGTDWRSLDAGSAQGRVESPLIR
jgi:stage II sporulation protein D